MYRELYIVKCALDEIAAVSSPQVLRNLRVYEVRIDNATSKAQAYGDTPELRAERLEAFHNFQQAFDKAQLFQYLPWSEVELLAERCQRFDNLPTEKEKEEHYLACIADFMQQELQNE